MEAAILKGISPAIGPDLIHMLASMGHGDTLVVADANFPATSIAQRLVRLDGIDAITALTAILTLIPLDQYVESPASVMAVVDDPEATPEIYDDFQNVIDTSEGKRIQMERVERFAFYERAKQAFGVVATSEGRLYGNIIISKGVVAPR